MSHAIAPISNKKMMMKIQVTFGRLRTNAESVVMASIRQNSHTNRTTRPATPSKNSTLERYRSSRAFVAGSAAGADVRRQVAARRDRVRVQQTRERFDSVDEPGS